MRPSETSPPIAGSSCTAAWFQANRCGSCVSLDHASRGDGPEFERHEGFMEQHLQLPAQTDFVWRRMLDAPPTWALWLPVGFAFLVLALLALFRDKGWNKLIAPTLVVAVSCPRSTSSPATTCSSVSSRGGTSSAPRWRSRSFTSPSCTARTRSRSIRSSRPVSASCAAASIRSWRSCSFCRVARRSRSRSSARRFSCCTTSRARCLSATTSRRRGRTRSRFPLARTRCTASSPSATRPRIGSR